MSSTKKSTTAKAKSPAQGGNIDVWGILTCNSTRKALKLFESKKVAHTFKDLRESAPPKTLLREALKSVDAPKQLFNRSGKAYQEGQYKDKVDSMTKEQIVDEMVANPMLIKRPLVKGPGGVAVGFDEDTLASIAR